MAKSRKGVKRPAPITSSQTAPKRPAPITSSQTAPKRPRIISATAKARATENLLTAINDNNIEMVQLALESGANVNATDGETRLRPLHHAASNGFAAGVELLLRSGADVNYAIRDGTTALQCALDERSEPVIRCLLKNGANPTSKRRVPRGMNALHIAAESRWLEVVQLLLKRNVDVNELTAWEDSALLYAVQNTDEEMSRLLLEHGADPNYARSGRSLVHMAASEGSANLLQLLLEKGAAADSEQLKGDYVTALHIALGNADTQMVRVLIEHGASVDTRTRFLDRSPLHLAALHGCVETVMLLLVKGAVVDVLDHCMMTPLMLAVTKKHTAIAELLRKHLSCDSDHMKVVKSG